MLLLVNCEFKKNLHPSLYFWIILYLYIKHDLRLNF